MDICVKAKQNYGYACFWDGHAKVPCNETVSVATGTTS